MPLTKTMLRLVDGSEELLLILCGVLTLGGILVTWNDIVAVRRAEAEVADAQARYEAAGDSYLDTLDDAYLTGAIDQDEYLARIEEANTDDAELLASRRETGSERS